jgi:polyisoprenoid-binding protein YceI
MTSLNVRRNKWKYAIGVVVVVVVLAIAGPFVFIHFIEGKPPAKLSLSDTTTSTSGVSTTSTTAPGSNGIEGTYKVQSGSQAGYRVKEVLFGQSTTAVGRTSDVSGSMTIAGTTVTAADFVVQLDNVTSDQSNRDQQFKTRIMDVAMYPTAEFKLTQPIDLGSVPANGKTITEKATGTFMIHGTTKMVTIDLTAKRSDTGIAVNAEIPITFSDYNIPNPTFGPAQTGDDGTIEVLVNLAQ